LEPSERVESSSKEPFASPPWKIFKTGGQVPTIIVHPASARALAMAQPYPVESPTPAMNAIFPFKSTLVDMCNADVDGLLEARIWTMEFVKESELDLVTMAENKFQRQQ
jgi:hypothetical protein